MKETLTLCITALLITLLICATTREYYAEYISNGYEETACSEIDQMVINKCWKKIKQNQ